MENRKDIAEEYTNSTDGWVVYPSRTTCLKHKLFYIYNFPCHKTVTVSVCACVYMVSVSGVEINMVRENTAQTCLYQGKTSISL